MADRYEDARRIANEYPDLFGKNNFFLEMQDHGLDQDKQVMPQIKRMSTDTGIPLVVTNDSHYLTHDDVRAHEILLCIQTGKTMKDPNRMRFSTPDFYVKSRAEMMKLFGEVEHALDRTWDIAQRCHVELKRSKIRFRASTFRPAHRSTAFSLTSRAKVSKNGDLVWKRCAHKAA